VSTSPGAPIAPDEPLGATLARMRRARRVTGAALAVMVGMSQPKISRIERGKGNVDPEDVVAIARALGADESRIQSLRERAERTQDRLTEWQPTSDPLAKRQEDMGVWEAAATEVRDFQPAAVAGQLQTSGYARAVLVTFQRLARLSDDELTETAILAAVSARVRRQETLADRTKSFHFVMTEAVLRNPACPPAEMLAQIGHLRDVAERYANVTIGIVPDGTPVDIPPLHGFTLLDANLVVIDVYNTGLITRGPLDVATYRRVFDMFDARAVDAIEPILAKYEAFYLEQLRNRPRSGPSSP
jgi:transcriptional regulator with XRE-family HTH domain